MSESSVLFLDANTLASPVTRTLVIAGARADGLRVTWSFHVEAEADRHTRGTAAMVSTVRTSILGMELSPTAASTDGLMTVSAQDRQGVADLAVCSVMVPPRDAGHPALASAESWAHLGDYMGSKVGMMRLRYWSKWGTVKAA